MVTTAFVTVLVTTIAIFIRQFLFAIGKALCWIVGFLTEVFEIVAGLKNVTYISEATGQTKLISVFFGNTNVNTIYWGMALIGIVLCFGFTIFAVIKKSGDAGDKMKQSYGDIIRNCFKGITLIFLMNFILSATISITSTLIDRINYLIVNAQSFEMDYDVTFNDEDYACMARSLNTIGNYSLNASYNNRYNLNSCYNDVRKDLKQLADNGKFDVTYVSTDRDDDGNVVTLNTWQSVLQNIYRSVNDISEDQPLDEYNTKLSESLLEAMDIIKYDASFQALEKYHVNKSVQQVGEMVSLDRMIMLLGSMYGTGGNLSVGSGMTDALRGPYYYGQKDIFSYTQVNRDFEMKIGTWLYLTVIVVAILFIKEMLAMVFNATARIFNMLLLYIAAPPIIAVTPLDDGGKLKQWTTAFIIQSFGLFGTIISLRLVMLFIPLLFSGELRLFQSVRTDTFARVIIMYGALFTARKASGMIVGILADNAGWQAISAGDVGGDARGAVETGFGLGKTIGGYGLGLAAKGLSKADEAVEKHKQKQKEGGGASANTSTKQAPPAPPQPVNMLDMGSNSAADNGTPGRFNEAPELSNRPRLSLENTSEQNNSSNSSNSQNAANNSVPPAPPLPNGVVPNVNQNGESNQNSSQTNSSNASDPNAPQKNNGGSKPRGQSRTFEDSEVSERKNRSIPNSLRDRFK